MLSPSTELRQPTRARTGPQAPLREARLIWPLEALVRWSITVTVSGVVLVAAWFNASGKGSWNDQVPAADVAIIAVVVSSAACIGLLINGRRAIGLRREALLGDPGSARPAAAVATEIPAQRASTTLVGGPGLVHFHRSDCSMAVGRGWATASRAEHARDGKSACGVCQP